MTNESAVPFAILRNNYNIPFTATSCKIKCEQDWLRNSIVLFFNYINSVCVYDDLLLVFYDLLLRMANNSSRVVSVTGCLAVPVSKSGTIKSAP